MMTPRQHIDLGMMLELLMASPHYSARSIKFVRDGVARAVELGQYRLYHDGERPIGFVTWAFMSEHAGTRFLNTGVLGLNDWRSGDDVWILDLAAPYGHMNDIARDVKTHLFPDNVMYARRSIRPGRRHRYLGVNYVRKHVRAAA